MLCQYPGCFEEIEGQLPEESVTSRGGVANEAALIACLKEERIAGAGLDVFTDEPPGRDHPAYGLKNVILTPHAAGLTAECVIKVSILAAQAAVNIICGIRPEGIVNPEALNHPRWSKAKKLTEGAYS